VRACVSVSVCVCIHSIYTHIEIPRPLYTTQVRLEGETGPRSARPGAAEAAWKRES